MWKNGFHSLSTYARLLLEWRMVKLLICNFVVKPTRIQLFFCLKKRFTVQFGFTIAKVMTVAFDRPKTGGVRAKTCSTEQHDWHLPGRWLMPCIVAGTTGKLNSHGFSFWLKSPSAKQHQNPCSGPPSVYQDLGMCYDWPVKKVIVNLPISMKETWNIHPIIHWVCHSMKETLNVH